MAIDSIDNKIVKLNIEPIAFCMVQDATMPVSFGFIITEFNFQFEQLFLVSHDALTVNQLIDKLHTFDPELVITADFFKNNNLINLNSTSVGFPYSYLSVVYYQQDRFIIRLVHFEPLINRNLQLSVVSPDKPIHEIGMNVDAVPEAERMLNTLFGNLPGMAYRCRNDRDWTMEIVSDGCFELTGYQQSDLIHNTRISFNDIIRQDYQEYLWVKWQQKLALHQYFEEEYPIVLPDGTEKWVYERGCGVFDRSGNLLALEGYITDIDNLKKANLLVEKSYGYFKSIFDSINDAVFIHELPSGKVLDVNKRACELFGYSYNELILMSVAELSVLDVSYSQENAQKLILKAYDKGPQIIEWCAKNRKNELFWVEINACHARINNDERVVITVRDISERKMAQQKLTKSEKDLKELNALKDKFFSIIAHDLKSPFNAILGFSELLCNDYEVFTDTERKRQILNIYESSSNAYKLLQNLLDWARLQIGRFEIKPVQIELAGTINEIAGIFKTMANEKGISLKVDVEPDLIVVADSNMLSIVMRNLLVNAIKFSFKNSEISVFITPGTPGFLVVNVEDYGIGIMQEDIDKLFKLEYKVQQNGTAKETGTGLGLIICNDFVHAMGGSIGVESEPGRGSRFWFSLPVAGNSA